MKKPVGIAIIGTGFARKVQIPGFAACDGAKIVSVASGHEENAKATAEEFGVPHFTADWRESVDRDDVDLVCITTPPDLHREMTVFSLERGKHVLCEKPMAMNLAEAEDMLSAARQAGVLALIDHELRFLPGRQRAHAMLREGVIGRIRHAKYNFRASYRANPDATWNWWSDAVQGGGALGAINSHVIDSLNWLLGTTVSSVSCQLQTHIKERRDHSGEVREVTSDDEANMLLRFADSELTEDATGLVAVSMSEPPESRNRVEIFGTEGAMRIDNLGELYLARRGETDWRKIDGEPARSLPGGPDSGFSRGFMHLAPVLVEAISEERSEIPDAATFEDGVEVQKVLDAARLSNAEGRVVAIEP